MTGGNNQGFISISFHSKNKIGTMTPINTNIALPNIRQPRQISGFGKRNPDSTLSCRSLIPRSYPGGLRTVSGNRGSAV